MLAKHSQEQDYAEHHSRIKFTGHAAPATPQGSTCEAGIGHHKRYKSYLLAFGIEAGTHQAWHPQLFILQRLQQMSQGLYY
jgi:hypothetical protein